jgi:hypothetical protein
VDFAAIAKRSGKSIEEVRRMSIPERLTYYQEAYAKVWDEKPEVLLATNLAAAAKGVQRHEFVSGIKRLFAKPMKLTPASEAELDLIKNAKRVRKWLQGGKEDAGVVSDILSLWRDKFRTVAPGWLPGEALDESLAGYVVKEETFRQASQYMRSMHDMTWAKGFFADLNMVVNLGKAMQLSWTGSIIRDVLGNKYLRALNGGIHPETTMQSPALLKIMMSGGNAEKLKDISITVGGKRMAGTEFHNMATHYGLMGTTEVFELTERIEQSARRGATVRMAQNISQGIPTGAAMAAGLGLAGVPFAPLVIPLAVAAAAKGKVINLQKAREFMSELDRLSMFHARLAHGDTPAEAVNKTISTLYDYSTVSPFVEMTRRTGLIPFATWSSKNIPAAIELLFTRPGTYAAFLHAKRAAETGIPGMRPEDVPEYIRKQWNVIIGRKPDGTVIYRTLENVLPSADIAAVEDPIRFMAQALGPLPQALLAMGNYDLYNRKVIEEFNGQYDIMRLPGLPDMPVPVRTKKGIEIMIGRPMTMLEQYAKLSDETAPGADEKKISSSNSIINALTGISPATYSQRGEWLRQVGREEKEISAMRQAATRFRRRGRPDLEADLLQKADEREAALRGGRLAPAYQESRRLRNIRSTETKQRRKELRESNYEVE